MVCYLCNDYTREPLIKCRNLLCKVYFHKSCWKKYLNINNLNTSICKVCYNGEINVTIGPNNGEVKMCKCVSFFKNLF